MVFNITVTILKIRSATAATLFSEQETAYYSNGEEEYCTADSAASEIVS